MTDISYCSMATVAREAGVAKSTASLALRGSTRVDAATAARVKAAAARLNYRIDPRVGSLMANIRKAKSIKHRERLAFVWLATSREERLRHRFSACVYAGAKRRAEALGCVLEEFFLDEDGMTEARLEKILVTRGITGVVFSTPFRTMQAKVRWNWDNFSAVLIGNSEFDPLLHRVGEHNYRIMWVAMDRLREAGCRRPAGVLFEPHHKRHHAVDHAAFIENHPLPPRQALGMTRFGLPDTRDETLEWLHEVKADSLVFGMNPPDETISWLQTLPQLKCMVTLDVPKAGLPCIRVQPALIAASSVDMVLGMLHRYERGVPSHPTTQMIEGEWWET